MLLNSFLQVTMYSYHRPTCSYRDCKNRTSTSKTFFEIPSEHSRREQWLKLCGISDEESAKIILYRTPIFVCEDHFDRRQMQYLQDGRKILTPNTNPLPWQSSVKPESAGSGFSYDEQATQMLQIFEQNNTEQDLYDYIFARNYVQPEAQAPTNEQLMILNQNYMLQAQAQLQQSQLFLTQTTAAAAATAQSQSHQLQQMRTNTTDRPKQTRRPRNYNRQPKNQYVYEEPEPPKKDVLCFSVKNNELINKDGNKASVGNGSASGSSSHTTHAADTGSLDIEEQIETYFILNDKNDKDGKPEVNNMILGN